MAMDEVKDKAKGIMKKLNPFSSSSRFKGEAHTLAAPLNPPQNAAAGGGAAAPSPSPRISRRSQQEIQNNEWRKAQQERWEAAQIKQDKSNKAAAKPKVSSSLARAAFRDEDRQNHSAILPPSHSSPAPVVENTANTVEDFSSSKGTVAASVSESDKEQLEMQVAMFLSAGASNATVEVILRLLSNISRDPKSEKFRKFRLGNPKIQETIGSAAGGVEFLESLGFTSLIQMDEDWCVLDEPSIHHLRLLDEVIGLLETHLRTHPSPAEAQEAGAAEDDTRTPTSSLEPDHDRDVKVFYASPGESVVRAAELSDDFFELSIDEVKKLAVSKRKKLEESQLLVPKSFREKQAAAARQKYKFSVIRVHFPDNVVLQGVFLPKESTAAIYSFVKSALKIEVSFDLIDPAGGVKSRVISSSGDSTLDQATLVPTALLKFRTASADYSGLHPDYLSKIQPLTPSAF